MSEVTPTVSQTPAPEGHDAAMAAKFDEAQGTAPVTNTPEVTPEAPVKPDWLPEKFYKDGKPDYAALAESYKELERTKGKPETAAEVDPALAAAATKDDAQQALESVGLDYSAIATRFQEQGSLAAEDRAALNKAGVPDGMIDAYVAGQKARLDETLNGIYDVAGGEAEYTKIADWAKKGGLSPAELRAYSDTVEKGDVNVAKLAVQGLKAQYDAKMGSDPALITAQTGPGSAGDVFQSSEQLVEAMKNPLYRTDPAYRAEVAAKLARSKIM